MAYRVEKQGKKTWYSFGLPIVEDWAKVSECPDEEYEERTKNYVKDEIHYVTIEIPLSVLATNEDLQKKLVFLRLVYSHMESITRKGVTYLSHIDITDILDFLPKEEFLKFKAAGVRFPADVEALYSENEENAEAP